MLRIFVVFWTSDFTWTLKLAIWSKWVPKYLLGRIRTSKWDGHLRICVVCVIYVGISSICLHSHMHTIEITAGVKKNK